MGRVLIEVGALFVGYCNMNNNTNGNGVKTDK
jgi:hypothetical protein